jgi:hypothetical protein
MLRGLLGVGEREERVALGIWGKGGDAGGFIGADAEILSFLAGDDISVCIDPGDNGNVLPVDSVLCHLDVGGVEVKAKDGDEDAEGDEDD